MLYGLEHTCSLHWGFPGDSDGKESTCNAGDQVQSLGWEDSLEKGQATQSSILAWTIPWKEEPGEGYNPWGHKESGLSD